jgi:hypothetical protein
MSWFISNLVSAAKSDTPQRAAISPSSTLPAIPILTHGSQTRPAVVTATGLRTSLCLGENAGLGT